jgi:hypothetical protein
MLLILKRHVVAEGMRTSAMVQDYKIDIKGKAILVYTAEQDMDALAALFKDMYPDPTANVELMTTLRTTLHYSPLLVFQLVDATRRTFQTHRYYCLRVRRRLDRDWATGETGNAGQNVCQTSRPGVICGTLVRAHLLAERDRMPLN